LGAHCAVADGEHEFTVRVRDLAGLGMLQHLDTFGAERGRDGLTDGRVFTEEQRAARQDRDLAAQPGERLGQFQGHHRRADDRQPGRNRSTHQRFGRSPIRCLFEAKDRRHDRTGSSGDQATVERYRVFAAIVQIDDQCVLVLETGVAVQHGDGRIAVQDAFVLGVPQLIDARLLLCQQFCAVNRRLGRRDATIERTFPAQMCDMRGADHDLRWHAANVDAGATDGAALNQGDTRTSLNGFERCCHRGSAAANDGDMQCAFTFTGLVLTPQPSQRFIAHANLLFSRWRIGACGRIAETGHGGRERVQLRARFEGELCRALRVGHNRRAHVLYLLQRFFEVRST
jgi:hypothetical protein